MILTVAFEGLNRSGKGTQLGLMRHHLRQCEIPTVTIRGDGSREGLGVDEGDPPSDWWKQFRQREKQQHTEAERFACWNEAANTLAAELLDWRREILPHQVNQQGAPFGVLLVDRSLISRMMLAADANPGFQLDELYSGTWREQPLTWKVVLPDLIFLLQVDQPTLLGRLDRQDPKYQFRRRLIAEKYTLHSHLTASLPAVITAVTHPVDGSATPGRVHQRCLDTLRTLVEERTGTVSYLG